MSGRPRTPIIAPRACSSTTTPPRCEHGGDGRTQVRGESRHQVVGGVYQHKVEPSAGLGLGAQALAPPPVQPPAGDLRGRARRRSFGWRAPQTGRTPRPPRMPRPATAPPLPRRPYPRTGRAPPRHLGVPKSRRATRARGPTWVESPCRVAPPTSCHGTPRRRFASSVQQPGHVGKRLAHRVRQQRVLGVGKARVASQGCAGHLPCLRQRAAIT